MRAASTIHSDGITPANINQVKKSHTTNGLYGAAAIIARNCRACHEYGVDLHASKRIESGKGALTSVLTRRSADSRARLARPLPSECLRGRSVMGIRVSEFIERVLCRRVMKVEVVISQLARHTVFHGRECACDPVLETPDAPTASTADPVYSRSDTFLTHFG